MEEVQIIKERLAHDGCFVNLKVLKKALLMPEEPLRIPSSYVYPTPKAGLMINPNPKVAKKKKKKGRK